MGKAGEEDKEPAQVSEREGRHDGDWEERTLDVEACEDLPSI